MNQHISLIS